MRRSKLFLILSLTLINAVYAGKPEIIREQMVKDQQALVTKVSNPQQQEQDIITIWIHGTNSFQWVKKIFFRKFFYTFPGMHNICKLPANVHLSEIAETLSKADPAHFSLKNLYVFCWSGKLSPSARKKAGKDLTNAVKKLTNEYRATHDGRTPKIIIITHSHGANVALNMIKEEDGPIVSSLIMLAPPVQEMTASRCHDTELFEEVYSLYSTKDLMQVMDPQKFYGARSMFSKRRFPHQENVLQAEIIMDGRSPWHIDFILQPFLSFLPRVIEKMHSWRDNGRNQEEKIHILELCDVA